MEKPPGLTEEKRERLKKHLVPCPHCGVEILDHMTECPHCKQPVTPRGYTADPKKQAAAKRISLLVGALLTIAIVGAIILFH
jgi:hypothetical protein